MNRKHSNSTSMNDSARISNLEYASFNLFIKLFYNELIFAFLLSLNSRVLSHVVHHSLVMLFISVVVEWKKCCKTYEYFCCSMKHQYCIFNKRCVKWKIISCFKTSRGSWYTRNKCSQVCQRTAI